VPDQVALVEGNPLKLWAGISSVVPGGMATTSSQKTVSWKRVVAGLHDAFMSGVAMFLALFVRYGGLEQLPSHKLIVVWVISFIVLAAIIYSFFGLARGMWRFASMTDLSAIIMATTTLVLVFPAAMFTIDKLDHLPRTVPLIAWFMTIVMLGAPRLMYRALKDGVFNNFLGLQKNDDKVENLLIIGTPNQADHIFRIFGLESSKNYQVHGIIAFNSEKSGRFVRGTPILGTLEDLREIMARLLRNGIEVDAAILAEQASNVSVVPRLIKAIEGLNLPLRRIAAQNLSANTPKLETLRLEDLLGRPTNHLDMTGIRKLVSDKVVLITGAGGSIGSEISRQVASFGPKRIILLDSSEFALYEIDRDIGQEFGSVEKAAVIADVRDDERIRSLMLEEKPQIVFHAAALKHVPLVEANVCEGARTNILGSRNVADAAVKAGVAAFVMISTDKAIRPTNVMGATKRVAEAYCQALDLSGVSTRFITVRFGNVLGSTGSVVPLFKRQIAAGGPITVTHADVKRYFMTVQEATALVLQAAACGLMRPDQRGTIFVLDMGEPIKIVDLARTMIMLAGMQPDQDIKIEVTGLRPGEKLFEELFDKDEPTIPSGVPGIFVAAARKTKLEKLRTIFKSLEISTTKLDVGKTRVEIAKVVPELPTS
jgi:FlaA1/EpsC-like NDP-sugar epimerase